MSVLLPDYSLAMTNMNGEILPHATTSLSTAVGMNGQASPLAPASSADTTKDAKPTNGLSTCVLESPPSPALKCTWPSCTHGKFFPRKSDLAKHMDKHVRPYACQNPSCNSVDFGDKAGLHRHEREQHGPVKFICPVLSCNRNAKGFPRKRNLEQHIKTRHQTSINGINSSQANQNDTHFLSPNTPEETEVLDSGEASSAGKQFSVETTSLQSKLQQLEVEKRELAVRQARVEEDILALKRALKIVSG